MKNEEFNNKNVVVTGGCRGLGSVIVRRFLSLGANVSIIDKKPINVFNKSFQSSLKIYEGDVGNYNHLLEIRSDLLKKWNRIDILVNNAGIARVSPFMDQEYSDMEALVKTNIIGTFNSTQIFGAIMVKNRNGSIINVASTDAIVGKACQDCELGVINVVTYASTKGAIISFTKALAVEWGKYNIRVNAVCPSLIRTTMTRHLFSDINKVNRYKSLLPLGVIPTADDVANSVLFLASDKARSITGHILVVDSGYLAYGGVGEP